MSRFTSVYPGSIGVDPGESVAKAITIPAAPAGGLRGLAAHFAAVGNRDAASAKVLCIGDSITESTGASSWTNRTISKYELKMRARYPTPGVTGGFGYVPATTAFLPVPPVTVVDGANGGHSTFATKNDGGLGMKILNVHGNGGAGTSAVATWAAQTCDRIRVWYTQPDAFAQDGVVSIDGTPTVTLTGANTPYRGGQVWDSGAITLASHTVAVTCDGVFGFNVEAVEFFNGDWDKGIHVYDGAHFGFNTADFIGAGPDRTHWNAMATLKPQLTIVNLGTNDATTLTAAQFLTNLDTILASIAAANSGIDYSVLLVLPYIPARSLGDSRWPEWRIGLLDRRSHKVDAIDLNSSWPALAMDGSTNKGLMNEATDPLHPSNQGHDYIASIYARATSV